MIVPPRSWEVTTRMMQTTEETMSPIDGVLETCLYAADLGAAERFYHGVLGLSVDARVAERHVFFRCGSGMLLVFDPARTSSDAGQVSGVSVPSHGTRGAGHVCFRVAESTLSEWRARLEAAGVAIEAEITWPRGGASVYVRDPAGNSVELAPARIWGLPE
jgi:catechol 2,3-dioxygenase-like lactoylglutathione lyase family enzyme